VKADINININNIKIWFKYSILLVNRRSFDMMLEAIGSENRLSDTAE